MNKKKRKKERSDWKDTKQTWYKKEYKKIPEPVRMYMSLSNGKLGLRTKVMIYKQVLLSFKDEKYSNMQEALDEEIRMVKVRKRRRSKGIL